VNFRQEFFNDDFVIKIDVGNSGKQPLNHQAVGIGCGLGLPRNTSQRYERSGQLVTRLLTSGVFAIIWSVYYPLFLQQNRLP
jgi:hypothetical protein